MQSSVESGTTKSEGTQGYRLARACEHVNKFWFPVNISLVEKIRTGLREGVYDLDLDFLLQEIKTDLALFTHCLRCVGQHMRAEGVRIAGCLNAMDLLRWAGQGRLAKIINDPALTQSKHSLSQMRKEQLSPMQKAIVGASAAEVLSQSQNLSPEVGFSLGLLRQLGLILIAWNYAQVYEETISRLPADQDIDIALSQALGFSPVTLAISVVKDWGLASEITGFLVNEPRPPAADPAEQPKLNSVMDRLQKICEVSETLARANSPELYPHAEQDWASAKKEIVAFFGNDNLAIIQKQVRENCENYLAYYPQAFSGVAELDPAKHIDARKRAVLGRENPYLDACAGVLKKRLEELYAKLVPGKPSRENLVTLVREIVPSAGYTGGCIFILDPATNKLMPRVKIGEMRLVECEPVNCSTKSGMESPVATAFSCSSPITEQVLSKDLTVLGYIAGAIGEERKVGVLYLELPGAAPTSVESDRLLRFKAIRQTFVDCLNL